MQLGQASEAVPEESDRSTASSPILRLAVISSPRSGNTWLREMIAALYGLEQIPVHFPDAVPWEDLPRRCILQIHWNPEPDFTSLLDLHGIRVVVIARHPFDILMSYLNYVYYVHQERICLGEDGCKECVIVGATPRSERFLSYVGREEGELLLGFTPNWWNRPGILRFRYEDLVADTETHLRRLVRQVGEPPIRPIAEVIEANSIGQMKPNREVWQYHFWQGRPGLWRSMIPRAEAERLVALRPEVFETLDYPVDPDPVLEPLQADLNWLQLQLHSTREHLGLERTKHRKMIAEAKDLGEQLSVARRDAAEKEDVYNATHAELLRYRQEFLETRDQLLGKGREVDGTVLRLEETYRQLDTTYQQLDTTYHELQTSGQALQTIHDELRSTREEIQVMSQQLDETRLRLLEALQRLVSLDELGPRGTKWALRVMRMYRKAKPVLLPPPPSSGPISGGVPAAALFRRPRAGTHSEWVAN